MTSAQWQALINSDPGLNLTEGQLSSGDVSNLDQRNSQIQQALAAFGGPVDLAQIASQLGLSTNDLSGLDSATIQQLAKEADQSGVSTSARLGQANTTAIAGIKNALAARGLLRSSALNNELTTQNQNFTNAEFDAHQKLLTALQQYQQGYLTYKSQMSQQLAQAINDAANRAASQWGLLSQANGPQSPDVAGEKYNQGVNALSNLVQSGNAVPSDLGGYANPDTAAGKFAQSVLQQQSLLGKFQ